MKKSYPFTDMCSNIFVGPMNLFDKCKKYSKTDLKKFVRNISNENLFCSVTKTVFDGTCERRSHEAHKPFQPFSRLQEKLCQTKLKKNNHYIMKH